ncbi:MAG: hypothetical protein ACUVRY_03965 [Thermoanaerobaculaceae bacterium]
MFAVSWLLSSTLAVMPVGEVRPAQKGVCLTEWAGGVKISVPIEVIGTLEATRPGGRAVLVRLVDPRFADSGVVAGMSGSPVYVEGKLLGAIAFGWNFAREPLAGVTPFEDMVAIPVSNHSQGASRAFQIADLPAAMAGTLSVSQLMPSMLPGHYQTPIVLPQRGPLEVPWQQLGLLPVFGGSAESTLEAPPEAGDMVAAVLVWGDVQIAAGGTLTAREGNTFFAFGHPLVAAGHVRMPAVRARVLAVQSSYAVPFKIFSLGKPFGTFVADQPAGMVAVAGEPPKGLPVNVTVRAGQSVADFRFHLAEVPLLQPILAAYLTASSLSFNQGQNTNLTVDLVAKITFADGNVLNLRQNTAAPDAVNRAATFVGALLGLLNNLPFPAPAIASVDLMTSRSDYQIGTVLEAVPHRRKVRPGERLKVTVNLQPSHSPPESRTLDLEIPRDLAPGKLDLIVADGAAFADYLFRSQKTTYANFPQLLAVLSRLEPSSHLVLALETQEPGLAFPAGAAPSLPPSVAALWFQPLPLGLSQRLTTNLVAVTRLAYPWPLSGALRVPLEVAPMEAP